MVINFEVSSDELRVFMDEAEEQIKLLHEDIIQLKGAKSNRVLLQKIFRTIHTLKGSSAMLGYDSMAQVAHFMESLLDRLRNDEITVNIDEIDALLSTVDSLKTLKDELLVKSICISNPTLNTLHSFVLITAQRLHKKLDFTIQAENDDAERMVINNFKNPLIHLLRNAIDHGIEPQEERVAKGKQGKGHIRLSIYKAENRIVIRLEDDGRGIDPELIIKTAVIKGLLLTEAASELSEIDAINLIYYPGMSTIEKATAVSGRGVGLDIVKTSVKQLNGTISLDTRIGEGTSFTIRLPLTT